MSSSDDARKLFGIDIRGTKDNPAGMSIHLDHCDRGRQLIGRRKKYRAAIEAAGLIGKTAAGQDIAESYAAVRGKAGAAIELIAAFEERSKRDVAGWLHCLSAQWNSRDYGAIDARSTEAKPHAPCLVTRICFDS
ncbi:MAG: hypothetical protein ABI407_01765 [Bradyrhizobium sp.]